VEGSFKVETVVERVVIFGYPSAPKGVTADGRPLTFEYDAASKILVIRKPDVKIAKSFTIELL
jgi:YD repeat-containing protein